MQVDLRWERVSYHRRLGGDVLTFGLMPVDSDVGFMKWKMGLQGGLISLHVQAPCIIVACACLHVRVDLVNGPDGATTLD